MFLPRRPTNIHSSYYILIILQSVRLYFYKRFVGQSSGSYAAFAFHGYSDYFACMFIVGVITPDFCLVNLYLLSFTCLASMTIFHRPLNTLRLRYNIIRCNTFSFAALLSAIIYAYFVAIIYFVLDIRVATIKRDP